MGLSCFSISSELCLLVQGTHGRQYVSADVGNPFVIYGWKAKATSASTNEGMRHCPGLCFVTMRTVVADSSKRNTQGRCL